MKKSTKYNFTKEELKHMKFLLIRRGYTPDQASSEIQQMIDTVEKNKLKRLTEQLNDEVEE